MEGNFYGKSLKTNVYKNKQAIFCSTLSQGWIYLYIVLRERWRELAVEECAIFFDKHSIVHMLCMYSLYATLLYTRMIQCDVVWIKLTMTH